MCFLELAALGVLKLSDEVLCNFGSQNDHTSNRDHLSESESTTNILDIT